MYELKSVNPTIETVILSDEHAQSVLDNISCLGKHMHTYFFFQIVKRNLYQLIDFINTSQNTLREVDVLECNRLVFNFVDTFYSYINFYESNYKEIFANIKKDLYDNNFEYAFIYALRNYTIHDDLPILKLNRECGEHGIRAKFIVSKEKLLASTRIKANAKMLISARYKDVSDIDISSILIVLKKLIVEIQIRTMDALASKLLLAFANLKGHVVNDEEIYLLKDGQIINGLLNVLNKYYKSMADNFVYDERLLSDKIINEIYMGFSYVYFGQEGVIYKPHE